MDALSTVSIRKASPADSASIAALHLSEISWGLLTSMGPAFVVAFYRTLLDSDVGFGFLAERDGRVLGHVTGVVHWRRFYRAFLGRNWRLAAGFLIRRAFDLGRWRRLIETSRYAVASTLPDAEFLSMAVRPEARGTGIANTLVRHLLAEFAGRGITRVRVATAASNAGAVRVFERSGFRLVGEVKIHPGEEANVYMITLRDEAQV